MYGYNRCVRRCIACCGGVGMTSPHGILTKKMIVPPTAVGGLGEGGQGLVGVGGGKTGFT